MQKFDWEIDLDDSVKKTETAVDKELNDEMSIILSKASLRRVEILKMVQEGKRTSKDIAAEIDIEIPSFHSLGLEEQGFLEVKDKSGRTNIYQVTEKAEELIDTFYQDVVSEEQYTLFEREDNTGRVAKGLLNTFYDSPGSFEALNRIGVDDDWEGLVSRLNQEHSEKERSTGEDIGDFGRYTPNSTLTTEHEGESSVNPESQREVERIRELREKDTGELETQGLENGSEVLDEVDDVLTSYEVIDGNLREVNERLRDNSEVQLTGLKDVSAGFYGTEVIEGPWHVDIEERKLPNDFDYVLVSKSGSSSISGIPQAEIEGYVLETDEGYELKNFK